MIGIDDEDISWAQGYSLASSCRQILIQHGFDSIHCEVFQAKVTDFASPETAVLRRPAETGLDVELVHPLTQFLGNEIAGMQTPEKAGTVGLYLQVPQVSELSQPAGPLVEPPPPACVVLLTCRHVLVFGDAQAEMDFTALGDSDTRVLQPTAGVLQSGINKCQANINLFKGQNSMMETNRQRRLEIGTFNEENDKEISIRIEDNQYMIAGIESALEIYQKFESLRPCVIGNVLHARHMVLDDKGWLPDWAIVKLQPKHFQSRLTDLSNQVYLGSSLPRIRDALGDLFKMDGLPVAINYTAQTITLGGTISVEELSRPRTLDDESNRAIFVMKRGRSTGVRWGTGSKILSVIKKYDGYGIETSIMTWPVLSLHGKHKAGSFSERGDSGSAVFDAEGRVAGILTGGIEGNSTQQTDVTFVAPIEWIFKDMADAGFPPTMM